MKRSVFKTRTFVRWMKKTELTDNELAQAVKEMASGLIDADLGHGLYKKRVALPGRGKRGGARTLVATNKDDRWFFLFGFEKNERANISRKEKEALQKLASDFLSLGDEQIAALIANAEIVELHYGDSER